ncbi:NAD(P)-binding protein [Gonapodya prolifera JEL478]|uniref:NAD(P)-binding protein n=1 Tax=Gonapodya prolifera (strain JEL478) TaxID=1344416 RepID=A0A138ZYJ1_GONPJ|nr:NAD(P)-binding protein [Gonapodya prolifera JEL478]|eukprot:KXS09567.1 NAD(P)-binding protein [Gonapodya prolifera JEL478]
MSVRFAPHALRTCLRHPLAAASTPHRLHSSLSGYSRLKGKTAFITGASSGIGQATAFEFARHGANVILTARRKDRLQELETQICDEFPSSIVHSAQLDVQDRAAVFRVVEELPAELKDVDILLNNAGLVIGLDPLSTVSPEAVHTMLQTNVVGLINVTQAILPIFLARNRGHVINLGSIAGREAYANGSVYCGTKHFVNAATQSLRIELMSTGVRVTEVQPGMVETEFSVVRFSGDKDRADKVYEGMEPLSAGDIADTILYAASRPDNVVIAEMLVMPTAQGTATVAHRGGKK